MSHFRNVLLHEMLEHLHSMKFMMMSVFAVLLAVLCVTVQISDYKDRKTVYDEERVKAENAVRETKVYSQLNVPILIEPTPLAVFIRGSEPETGNKIMVSLTGFPEFENTTQTKNAFLDIFRSFDLITLIQVIFSIMTLFIVSDAIAGEREEGTLTLVFSNQIFKSQYFLAKFLGSLFILAVPLVLIFILTGLIIVMQPFMTLTPAHYGMILLILLCAVAFLSAFVLIGLLISSKSATASAAVLYGLILWIGVVFVYPNLTSYAVDSLVRVPDSEQVKQQYAEIRRNTAQKVQEATDPLADGGYYNWFSNDDFGLPAIIGLTQKSQFEDHVIRVRTGIPIVLDGINETIRAEDANKSRFIRQRRIAGMFTKLLPGSLLGESASKIAGTHYGLRDLAILNQAKQYREDLIGYMRSKNAFGLKYFTQTREEEMREKWEEYSSDKFKECQPDHWNPLDLSDMPVFRLQRRPIVPRESLVDLILLMLMNIVLFIAGGMVFSRSELRKME